MRARRVAIVEGVVQGVGFRPFVARLASESELAGAVRNDGGTVHLEVEGDAEALDRFARRLEAEAPAASRIERVRWRDASPTGGVAFTIEPSQPSQPSHPGATDALPIPPDLATCAECLAEVADPTARRFAYPFTNCCSCGPRFTIVESLPYDRPSTTMRGFAMCDACASEHADPRDRRHHAQPIACPACGPHLTLFDAGGAIAEKDEALERAAEALRRGAVLAMKGLGGYQLLCRADDATFVANLRDRKRRAEQPLAVMVASLEDARRVAFVNDAEARALSGSEAPIVLLRRRADGPLAPDVAPRLATVGVMLPTTPLHHLLLGRVRAPLVCTSGNLHEEPIAYEDADARARLGRLADLFLVHDRPIARRADDSVVRVIGGRARVLRLGRGLGPRALPLRGDGVPRLCVGGHLKNAPAAALEDHVVLWPHVGDLDGPSAREAFEASIDDLQRFLRFSPAEIVCDRHPDYASTIFAERRELPLRRIFHHHAHVAACLAEHPDPSIDHARGFAWDGFGLGEEGGLWGGEVFDMRGASATRVGHLRAFALPAGDAAARDGRRALAGLLLTAGREDSADDETARHLPVARSPRLAPPTSSLGRLFDAVAALLGVRARSSFEGQAAMELEAIAEPGAEPYEPRIEPRGGGARVMDWAPMLDGLLADRADPVRASSRFHATLTQWIVALSIGAPRVALSGGCFQNARLSEDVLADLEDRRIEVLLPERAPANDGGLALGQAWLAARGAGK